MVVGGGGRDGLEGLVFTFGPKPQLKFGSSWTIPSNSHIPKGGADLSPLDPFCLFYILTWKGIAFLSISKIWT